MADIDLAQKFKKYAVANHPRFPELMAKYNDFGTHLTIKDFYEKHVLALMPELTLRQWEYFVSKLREFQKEMVRKALQKSNRRAIETAKMEKNSLHNILSIADASLEAVAENPEIIHSIPLNTRVNWMFRAMKARDSRAKVAIQKRNDDRQQTAFEEIMQGAQYGGFSAEQVPVDEEGQDIIYADDETETETNTNLEPVPHELQSGV